MLKMQQGFLLILLTLFLSACPNSVDGRVIVLPEIEVSKSRAVAGEQVTVTGGFANIGAAHSPDYVVSNLRLGVCFGQIAAQPFEARGGLCLDKDLPLPPHIVIAGGQSYQKAFGKQVIKSGEEFVPEHTFLFTSTEPGPVRLAAMSQTVYEELPQPAFENSLDVEVQFEQ